jgi:hypothetical protein
VVCLHEDPPADRPAATPDDLRLRWCAAALGAARARVDVGRLPWPEVDLGPSDPERFDDEVERALEGCPARTVVTDCTEYPCVAVLAGDEPKRLDQRCPALDRLGGVSVVPTRCPDGRVVRTPILFAGTEAANQELLRGMIDSDEAAGWMPGLEILERVASRRVEDALALADPCGNGPSAE